MWCNGSTRALGARGAVQIRHIRFMKKICVYCGKEFEIPARQGGMNRKVCYDCVPDGLSKNERNKIERDIIHKIIQTEKLARGCDICGYNKCPAALEWHHTGDDKNFNPSDVLRKGTVAGLEHYKKETEQCILVCSNCHREIHWKENKE